MINIFSGFFLAEALYLVCGSTDETPDRQGKGGQPAHKDGSLFSALWGSGIKKSASSVPVNTPKETVCQSHCLNELNSSTQYLLRRFYPTENR